MIQGGSNDQTEVRTQLEAAYVEFGGAILRFATRLCGNRDDAEDIVVETFVRAFQSWNEYQGTGSRRAWLFGIAHNATRMARRRRSRTEIQISDEIEAPSGNAIEWIAIQQAVHELPTKQKESFLLVKGEGLTASEASDALNRPIGSILSEVFHALRFLRAKLSEKEPARSQSTKICEAEL
jgi:RNA polymerase sigma-70 factor (ECF subfamily)